MSWLFELRRIDSEKNGAITALRQWGTWKILVDTSGQTTPSLRSMWEDAFEKAKKYTGVTPVRNTLMLGLGAGGQVRTIEQYFPQTKLTVVEYDPAMISLAKELGFFTYSFPRIICEDARTAVTTLREKFDVIIVDLFNGATPSTLSADSDFRESLHRVLKRDGLLLLNVYKHEALIQECAKSLYLVKKWRFGKNHLALFAPRGAEDVRKEGGLPLREWPDFDPLSTMKHLNPARVGENPHGVYWSLGPFSFEKYVSDTEPHIPQLPQKLVRPFRIVMWQRSTRADRPKGWISFGDGPAYTFGFLRVDSGEYYKGWDESARRARRNWLSSFLGTKHRIESASFEEFAEAYKRGELPGSVKDLMLYGMRTKIEHTKSPFSFYVVRRIADGKAVAGCATVRSTGVPVEHYFAGFYTKETRHEPVMVGLFDYWHQEALKRGTKFLDLGFFWRSGRDRAWRGFSVFKGKFNPYYFFYPPLLYKFLIDFKN